MTKYQPREEARVLRFDDLTQQQKHAAFDVHALLRGYLERPYQKAKARNGLRRFTPHIDISRWNQNLLLDGDRGSGKTSLLVTMLHLWSERLSVKYDTTGDSRNSTDADEKDRQAKLAAWGIGDNGWSVVPLSIVDLQPLPEHTPVLLHLAEPLVRVVEAIEERDTPEAPSPVWLAADQHGLKSRASWEELVRTIVAGWDNAASDRWSRLDPENAEFEVNRAVRSHQAVVSSFSAFIDQLIEDFKTWSGWSKPPLFVLSVDDADMNPERAEELLEAIRMLNHPRLVFLLTGDSGLFLRLLEERVARSFCAPTGRRQRDASRTQDGQVQQLARRIYEKIIPPTHRCALPLLAEEGRAKHLEKLDGLVVQSSRHPKHKIPISHILKAPMIGAGLPGHLRALKDIDLLVERSTSDEDTPLSRVVKRIWDEAIEDSPTNQYTREQLETRVHLPPDKRPLVVTSLAPNPSFIDEGPWVRLDTPPATRGHTQTIELRGLVTLRSVNKDAGEVPQGLVSALTFADMVAFEHGVARGPDEPSTSQGLRPRFARVLYEIPAQPDPYVFGWPLPKGVTLLDTALIAFRWSNAVKQVDAQHPLDLDAMARWFLAVVAQLSTMYETAFEPLPAVPSESSPIPAWEEVARRVLWVAKRRGTLSPREVLIRGWAIGRAALLAAPESGLPVESARSLLLALVEAAGDDAFVRSMREQARVQRVERLRAAMRANATTTPNEAAVDEVRKLIDAAHGDHPWQAFISGRHVATPSSASSSATTDEEHVAQASFLAAMGNLGLIAETDDEKQSLVALPTGNVLLLRELTAALEQLRSLENPKQLAFHHLLNTAASHLRLRELDGYFKMAGKSLTFDPLPGYFDFTSTDARFPLQMTTPSSTELRDGAPYIVTTPNGEKLPSLFDFLYRSAWDARETDERHRIGDSPFTNLWSDQISATSTVHPRIRVRWPAPPWRTFQLYRSFNGSWRRLLDKVSQQRIVTIPEAKTQCSIALQYIEIGSMFRSALPRHFHFRFDPELHPNEVLAPISGTAPPHDANIDRAVQRASMRRWFQGLALLLAPESCLPGRLVAPLKSGLGSPLLDPLFWLSRDDVLALQKLRVARMSESLKRGPQGFRDGAQEVLAEIDAKNPPTVWNDFLRSLESVDPPTP